MVKFNRKLSSNDIFWILLFLYYSFGVEKTNTFISSRGALKNHTRFKTIMAKIYTVFRPKRLKSHILWGGTYILVFETSQFTKLSSSVWVEKFSFGEEHWFQRRVFSTPSLTQALDQSSPGISNTLSKLNVLSTDASRHVTADVSVHGAISRRHKIKRHKSPCIYYPNTVAAFNVELIGDLTFKLNPGPSLDGNNSIIISARTYRSRTTRPSIVSRNAYGITLGSNHGHLKGVNVQNLTSNTPRVPNTHWWHGTD